METDHTRTMNLRAALDVWPEGKAIPADPVGIAHESIGLLARDLMAGRVAPVSVVRFADDGVSLWLADAVAGISVEDFLRAVAGAFEPAATAIALVQPMTAGNDPTVRGVHCRAAVGLDLAEISGPVHGADGPLEARRIDDLQVRRGRFDSPAAGWLGVPPTVEIELPMLGLGQA